MTDTLFRPEVIDAQRDRLSGTVIAATPPGAKVYTLLVVAALVALIALLVLGTFATRERVTGIVAPDRGIARVYAPGPVEVRAVQVREGQEVAAGATLVTVAVTQGRDDRGEGVAGQIREIERQDAELARQQVLVRAQGITETGGLAAQRAGFAAEIASLERQRALAADQARLADAAVARAERLVKQAAGTRRQVEDARTQALARRTEAEALTRQTLAQREQLRRLANQIDERGLNAERSAAEIAATRAELAGRRAALLRQDRLALTAPVAGTIAALNAEVGQRASPETSLLSLIPAGSRMEVWLYAPSRAAGRVRAGQTVRLRFEAFPYQKYGAGQGTVVAVAASATDPSAVDPGLKIADPVYRVRVRVDRMANDPAVTPAQLRPGMTLAADLVLEQRRLWEVFFDPVLRALAR